MLFAQYLRIRAKTGPFCTSREFIKAAHTLLSDTGRSRTMRKARHNWLRDGLIFLEKD